MFAGTRFTVMEEKTVVLQPGIFTFSLIFFIIINSLHMIGFYRLDNNRFPDNVHEKDD